MKMITASLPKANQRNDKTMRILETALESYGGF